MTAWAFPDQHPDPFPELAAPTNTKEWGRVDAAVWLGECRPSMDEIEAVYEANEREDGAYHIGVGDTLWMLATTVTKSPGVDNHPI